MRRTTFVLVVALVALLAFSATAMATGYVGFTTSAGSGSDSPHMGYTTTTIKCEVCHAAHSGGAPNTVGGTPAPMLWQTAGLSAGWSQKPGAQACAYCHMTTSGGYVQVYYNANTFATAPDQYGPGPWDDPNSTTTSQDDGGHADMTCDSCHNTHGADTLNQGADAGMILAVNHDHHASGPAAWATSSNWNEKITYFCAQCHAFYGTGTDGNAPGVYTGAASDKANLGGHGSGPFKAYSTHPMVPANTYYNNSAYDPTTRGATIANNVQVAYADATYCRSCHAAGSDSQSESLGAGRVFGAQFPHYTTGASMFLANEGDHPPLNQTVGNSTYTTGRLTTYNDGTNTYTNATGVFDQGTKHAVDGVCLGCHRNSAGTAGVGINY